MSCGPDVLRPAPRSDRNIPAVELMEWRLNGNIFLFFIASIQSVNRDLRLDELPLLTTTLSNKLINAAGRSISGVLSVSVLLLFCHPRVWCTLLASIGLKTVT